jgi:hypothetical protein
MKAPKNVPPEKFPPGSNEPFPKMQDSSFFADINARVDTYGILIERDPGRLQAKINHCAGLKSDFYNWVSGHPKADQFESAFDWCNPRNGDFWAKYKRVDQSEVVVNTGEYFNNTAIYIPKSRLIETEVVGNWVEVSCLNYDILFLDFMTSSSVFLFFVFFLTVFYVNFLFKKIYSTFNWKRYIGMLLTTFVIFPSMQILAFFTIIMVSKVIRKGMSIYILAMCAFNV